MSKSITANAEGNTRPQNLRCQPGDLAIVIHSINPILIGHIVVVGVHRTDSAMWEVLDMGGEAFGIEADTGCPIVTNNWLFHDSALQPIRGGVEVLQEMLREVDHA